MRTGYIQQLNVMRILLLALFAVLLCACGSDGTEYETYVQANQTDTPDQALVLVVLKNPESPEARPDTALANFVLSEGQSQTETRLNKHYPGRVYSITASRLETNVLTVLISVEDSGNPIFQSKQRFASWAGF